MNNTLSLLLASAATLAVAQPAVAATVFEGSATVDELHTSDPGLVVFATPLSFGPFSLDLDGLTPTPSTFTTDVLTIGTNESDVSLFEDTAPYDITVGFTFVSPVGTSGSPITGYTRGRFLFQDGVVVWDGPTLFTFGNGGSFSVELANTSFGTPGSANVAGTFTLLTASVPEPATWAMMIGGFGMVGGAMRRRRGPSYSLAA